MTRLLPKITAHHALLAIVVLGAGWNDLGFKHCPVKKKKHLVSTHDREDAGKDRKEFA